MVLFVVIVSMIQVKIKMKNKYTKKQIKEFLSESNAIEAVFDEDSLQQALYAWEYLCKQKKITSAVICETHKNLMKKQTLKED